MRENWLQAYDFATKRGALFLGEYARSANPFADIGDKTVSVQVTSVVRASDTSFQVKWVESAFERGSLASSSRWTAILTVTVKPPNNAEPLRKNPSRQIERASFGERVCTTVSLLLVVAY